MTASLPLGLTLSCSFSIVSLCFSPSISAVNAGMLLIDDVFPPIAAAAAAAAARLVGLFASTGIPSISALYVGRGNTVWADDV